MGVNVKRHDEMAQWQVKSVERRALAMARIASSWTVAHTLRLGLRVFCLALAFAAGGYAEDRQRPTCEVPSRNISVDGLTNDWEGITPQSVQGEQHLWFGQGMTRDQWRDDHDLSYAWRAAWHDHRLYFLIEVTDDKVVEPNQPSSYLCDCVEIYLDPFKRGGQRVQVLDGRADWFDKCDPQELKGYELHFLPSEPPRVFLDHTDRYALEKPHTERFQRDWHGSVASKRTETGYVMEIGLVVPDLDLRSGLKLGAEIGVCDDDGQGRESILMWTGTKSDFWLVMDDYGILTLGEPVPAAAQTANTKLLGQLTDNVEVSAMAGPDGRWGLVVTSAGLASASQPQPIQLEVMDPAGQITARQAGYDRLEFNDNGCTCWGELALGDTTIQVTDHWTCQDQVLAVDRNLVVRGTDEGAFLSAVTWTLTKRQAWPDVTWFVPGMIYNGWDNLTEAAIGGKAFYQPGQYAMRIREDRVPAPLIAARCQDGTSLAVLNPRPVGTTTLADAADVTADKPLVDRRFAFGALGAHEEALGLTLGYWYPGTEGEVTYRGDTYPGGQLHAWRRRFHPLADGLSQQYRVEFRFGRDESLDKWRRDSWRWAWQRLAPQVTPQDIEAVRHSLADMLVAQILTSGDRSGLPNFINTQDLSQVDRKAILGFCGANLDAAVALLYEANRDSTPRGERLRDAASTVIDSFLKLTMAPPQGEGFLIDNGQPVTALCHTGDKQMFLRSFGDDLKRLLIAYEREKRAGREHPSWLAWCRQFADWLLTQQQPDGSFPRSWHQDTGQIHNGAGQGSYNAIPLLVVLHRITGDARYLESARRAGEYCWSHGQDRGVFVGGTIDNPNVIDKEAGTLSLEAYLALFEATGEEAWLQRAKAAGDFAESWIYLWNVPMPSDDNPSTLHWKPDVPTIGVQLIATGHSLVDCFMTYNAAHYAKLAKLSGDDHYREVARILLHNTKNMLAIPGRTYDLPGPGWQQEHWSFAPRRGQGLHRGWLPWVSTSHLNGLQALEELDTGLLK